MPEVVYGKEICQGGGQNYLATEKKLSKIALGSEKNDWMHIFNIRGSVWESVNGSVFTEISKI